LKKLIREFEAEMNDLPKAEQGVTISNNDNSSTTENYSMNTLKDGHINRLGDIINYGDNTSINVKIEPHGKEIRENPISLPIDQNSDPIYIKRPNLEKFCREQIDEAICLLRITAPTRMGKTMLVNRTLALAREGNYKTIKIDFKYPSSPKTKDNFLSHLCSELSDILNIHCSRNSINEDCLTFLLERMTNNLILALDSFEVLFLTEGDCVEIGSFLRFCHEQAKSNDNVGRNWRKLRIMIAYSTAKIPDFPVNQSPFNVGTIVDHNLGLKGFTSEQAKELLSIKYPQLIGQLSDTDLKSLVEFLNGHPELIQQSLLHLNYCPETMKSFLAKAPTEEGIFRDHLSLILTTLEKQSQSQSLIEDYKRVLTQGPIQLEDNRSSFVLRNLGIIKPLGNDYISSCDLYLKYFSNQFGLNRLFWFLFWFSCGNEVYTDSFFRKIALKVLLSKDLYDFISKAITQQGIT
jgi:hypothetical protein